MWYRAIVALGAMMTWAMVGCGSVDSRPMVLIEPEFSYVRHAEAVQPLGAPIARRGGAASSSLTTMQGGLNSPLDRTR